MWIIGIVAIVLIITSWIVVRRICAPRCRNCGVRIFHTTGNKGLCTFCRVGYVLDKIANKPTMLLMLLFMLFMPTVSHALTGVCYYLPEEVSGGWALPETNCEYFDSVCDSLGISNQILPISKFSIEAAGKFDVVYLSGYGDPEGFIPDVHEGYGTYAHIPWKDIAQIDTSVLLIDACFSGYVFDYPDKAPTVITSAYKTPSWNIMVDEDNVSSFVTMLRCMYDTSYTCPLNIRTCSVGNGLFSTPDPEDCQFNLIVDRLFRRGTGSFSIEQWKPFSVSTTYINGEPWRK